MLQTVFFTDFVGSAETQFWLGFGFEGTFGLMVLVYIATLIKNEMKRILRIRRLKKLKKSIVTIINQQNAEQPL